MRWSDVKLSTIGGSICGVWASFSIGGLLYSALTALVGTLVSFLTTSDSVFCASVYILVKIVIAAVKGVQLAKLISSQDFLPFTAFSVSFASNEKETSLG